MTKIWREIESTNGEYYVSSCGDVATTRYSPKKEKVENHNKDLYYIKATDNNHTLVVRIRINGVIQRCILRMIVATYFVENTNNYKFVKHKDGDYRNCSQENLEWVEYSTRNCKVKSDILDTKTERWVFIPNTNNLYKVSNLGNIFSMRRGKTLIPTLNSSGYMGLTISVDKKVKYLAIHNAVALSFIPNPLNKPCVDHIDGDKLNNNVNNLRWVTYLENINNPITISRIKGKRREHRKKVVQLKNGVLVKEYDSIRQAVNRNNLSYSCIYRCCLGISKEHQGFSWQFSQNK